ncbi:hypothetical protein Y032_0028g1781 [Ancylostoma ceylanicum]|uniref:Uncharacterized protein n=1 Tax=Ancylostoma ceylanicum TaxID=53326 RepID=A0A016UTZ6_9BILA|nr:hypothetical protein Y032_0028g1781 [Ancylostoma ceylanicum]
MRRRGLATLNVRAFRVTVVPSWAGSATVNENEVGSSSGKSETKPQYEIRNNSHSWSITTGKTLLSHHMLQCGTSASQHFSERHTKILVVFAVDGRVQGAVWMKYDQVSGKLHGANFDTNTSALSLSFILLLTMQGF